MKSLKGITLIEILVTIAVAAILMAIGAPSFTSLYEATRSDSSISTIQSSIIFARNQAVSYGANVTLCPLSSNACTNNWKNGFTIFIDKNASGSIEAGEQIIKVIGPFNSKDFVTHTASSIRFSTDGLVSAGQGQISYCPTSKTNENSKAIIINVSGRIQSSIATNITCS